eukprot:gene13980-14095_t
MNPHKSFMNEAFLDMMNPLVEIKLFPGKGRGLVTTRDVAAGEPVVVEQPLLMTAAALKLMGTAAGGANGVNSQRPGYDMLMELAGTATDASLNQAVTLQPALCQALGDSSCSVMGLAEVAALLVKEQLNSYGLLAPLHHQQDSTGSTRSLRGGGIYPTCALINHECLPNVARFDALDAAVGGLVPTNWPAGSPLTDGGTTTSSTLVVLRALHDLPAGTELTQSYFPLNWDLQERQQQAQQVYGFTCGCPRCLLECTPEWQQQQEEEEEDGSDRGDNSGSSGDWETDEESAADIPDGANVAGTSEDMVHEGVQGGVADELVGSSSYQQQQQLEPAYLSVFLLKYMCPREGCFGTMAAIQGSREGTCECCVCGSTRTNAQFLADLQQ